MTTNRPTGSKKVTEYPIICQPIESTVGNPYSALIYSAFVSRNYLIFSMVIL